MSKEETMVERCAGAIAKSDGYIGLDAVPRETRNMFIRRASAVIDALMEPTDAMKVAGGIMAEDMIFGGTGSGVIFTDIGEVFKAMLSKAKEGAGE